MKRGSPYILVGIGIGVWSCLIAAGEEGHISNTSAQRVTIRMRFADESEKTIEIQPKHAYSGAVSWFDATELQVNEVIITNTSSQHDFFGLFKSDMMTIKTNSPQQAQVIFKSRGRSGFTTSHMTVHAGGSASVSGSLARTVELTVNGVVFSRSIVS